MKNDIFVMSVTKRFTHFLRRKESTILQQNKERNERKRMKTITDHKLTFKEKEHEYKYEGIVFESVTSLIKRFKEEFDEQKISRLSAKKLGVSQERVLANWQLAMDEGTSVHEYAEFTILKKKVGKPITLRDKTLRTSVDKYFLSHLFLKPYLTEVRLALPTYQLAGTADLIMKTEDGTKTFLYDWKTNKKVWQSSFEGKKMKGRLSHLDDCNFVQYSLQLAIYKKMLESKGVKVDGCYIIHLFPEEAGKGNSSDEGWWEYKTLDLESEAQAILDFKAREIEENMIKEKK